LRISLAKAELPERKIATKSGGARTSDIYQPACSKPSSFQRERRKSETDWHYTRGACAPQSLISTSCSIGKVTTALLLRSVGSVTSKSPAAFNFVKPYSYELEKIHSSRLRGVMRFRGPDSEGTDDETWHFHGTDASPWCSNVGLTGANTNTRRHDVKSHIRIPQV
jgi:hypothetical protein